MTDKQTKLAQLKSEQRTLSLKVLDKTATKAEKMRLTMIRDEVRRLERFIMMRIAE